MTSAVLLYPVVAYLSRPGPFAVELPDLANPRELVVSILALLAIVAGFVVPRTIASTLRRRMSQDERPTDDQLAITAAPILLVRFALFESVAICGFFLALMGAPAGKTIPFAALAIAAMTLAFPSFDQVASLFRE